MTEDKTGKKKVGKNKRQTNRRKPAAKRTKKQSSPDEKTQFSQIAIDGTSDAIFWIGPDARILFVNDTAVKMLGYTQRELLNLKIFDIDQNISEKNWEQTWDSISRKKNSNIETEHRNINGESIPVEISAGFLEFIDSEYVIAYARPVSKRRKAESALAESENKFRFLSEQGLLAMAILQDGVIKYANHAMADLSGYSIKELLEMKFEGFGTMIHPEDRPFAITQARKKQAGDTEVVNNYSFRIISQKGETKWVELYSKTVSYQGKNADFVSLIDITDRIKADEVLKNAHDELEFLIKERTVELTQTNRQLKRRIFDLYTIFELSRNFNAVLNYETLLDSFVLTSLGQMGVAKAALYLPHKTGGSEFHLARMKGSPPFPSKEIAINSASEFGKYITAFNRPVYINDIRTHLPAEELQFTRFFEKGLIVPLIFQTKLRGILVLSGKESKARFRDEDIEFLSILANQTAVSIENARLYESEKEALRKLQEAQDLLLQSERLAVLGELSAKIAHEVNNPLGIIKNYLQLLNKQLEEEGDGNKYVSIISQEIDRIAIIVKQLLSLGKPIHVSMTRTDITTVIKDVLSLMARQFDEADIIVKLKIIEPVPEIMAWAEGLKQIFMNLLMNARYAVENNGEVYITVIPKEHTVEIIFEDTGPGIEKKHIPHIFEPFYTTKDGGFGSGLGLSVSNTIVSNHNGTITFKNSSRGGCFRIELPIEREKSEYDWTI